MSSIKVWTSDGNWSEAVNGCDKIHLMQGAIKMECSLAREFCNEKRLELSLYEGRLEKYDDGYEEFVIAQSISGLQVDNNEIFLSRIIDSEWVVDIEHLGLSNARFFKMRLSTLHKMAEKEKMMSAVYNKLIHLAKVPEKVSEGYCLFFMFYHE